ncbi:MAG: response regulator [Desulfobacterales bacterium]|nr:response regulator [Desulfobacterales bacterium]
MKVILVDDEQRFINMLAKRLALRGIQADAVFSGDDAIKKISNTTYDVAVLDIKMPGISGIQLKNELSALDPGLKFIFVTGHGEVNQPDEVLIEKDFYLSKPLDIEILIKKIEEIAKPG